MKRIISIWCCVLAMITTCTFAFANELVVTCTATNVTCNGANNGSATALVNGGILPYTYLWNNNENTSTITGLTPGIYSVIVTDAEGVSLATSCEVGIDNEWQVSCSSNPVTCDFIPSSCIETTLVLWDFANCGTSYSDYSEFTPSFPGNENCGVNASIVSRDSGTHSCNQGRENGDGIGFCVGDFDSPEYISDSFNAVRFSLSFGVGDQGNLSALKFWELADDTLQFLNNTTPIYNNYPTKYGVRILKNGNQIFLQKDIPTTTAYSLEYFNFSDMEAFEYSGPTTFEFELYAYDPIGNGALNFIWDLDDISVEGCCGTIPSPESMNASCDGSITCNTFGGSGQYSYSWTYNEDFNTGSFVQLPFDGPVLDSLCAGTYCVIVTDLITGCLECICIMVEEPVCMPIAVDDFVTVESGGSVDINVLINDLLPDNVIDATFQISSGPISGSAVLNIGTGTVTYTPDPNFVGSDSFTYVICNPFFCDSASVSITVTETGENHAPIANDDLITIEIGEPTLIDVQANDYDPDGDPLVTSILIAPLNGTATVLNGDSISYVPNPGFEGIESITYIVSDGNGNADSAVITIIVTSDNNSNESPVANDDLLFINIDATITIDVQANDFDPDGDPLTTFLSSLPLNGTATLLNGDSIVYAPNPGFEGTDTFTYAISDGNGGTDSATVTINVAETSNECPIALNDNVITDENIAISFNPLINDFDPDNGIDPTSLTLLAGPVNGIASVDPLSGEITYTPVTNFMDNDLIAYEVCDLNTPSCCDIGFIFITIIPDSINDCVSASDDDVLTQENTSITFNPLDNDSDVDDGIDPTSLTILSGPVNGSFNVDPNNGVITYTPNTNFIGTENLGYSVCDLNNPACCDSAFISITVLPDSLNNCPTVVNDSIITDENMPITFNALSNDFDLDSGIDPTSVSIVSGPVNGTATVDPVNGEITYNPGTNFIDDDLIAYEVCDLNIPPCCEIGFIVIDLVPDSINNCPDVLDDFAITDENVSITVDPLENDIDLDNGIDSTSVTLISGPVNGTAIVDPENGEINYTPGPDFSGQDIMGYSVCDLADTACCEIAYLTITILADSINNCPVAMNDTISTNENTLVTFDPLINDTDSDNGLDPTSVSILSGPLNGIANVDSDTGEITYIPNQNFSGSDLISYSVCDLSEPTCCDFAFIYITVISCSNSPLSAIEDSISTDEDSPVVIEVLANDIDADGDIDVSTLSVISLPEHGEVQVNANTGTITYEPDLNFFGIDSLVYQVSDTSCSVSNSDAAKVIISIHPVNDCPTANNDTTFTQQGIPLFITVHENDSDIDGSVDSTSVFIIGGLINGTANVDPITGTINYVPFSEYMGPDFITYVICDDGSPSCCDTATVHIDVVSIRDDICIPKAFSPNGDFYCDLFVISPNPKVYPQNELKIFNRWGNCVYQMNNYNNTWDGTSNTGGSLYGNEIHDGTYFYVFDLGNGDKPLNGSVVIKRK